MSQLAFKQAETVPPHRGNEKELTRTYTNGSSKQRTGNVQMIIAIFKDFTEF